MEIFIWIIVILGGIYFFVKSSSKSVSKQPLVNQSEFHQQVIYKELPNLLREATELSYTNWPGAILKIREYLREYPQDPSAQKKLASYMFKNGDEIEAIQYLEDYFPTCDILSKSTILEHIAVLYKRQKKNIDAIKYDCYANYFYTMYSASIAFNSFNDFYDSIGLQRDYKEAELEKRIEKNLKSFWGIDWLRKYYKQYRMYDEQESANLENVIYKLQPLFAEKSFDNFRMFVDNLINK